MPRIVLDGGGLSLEDVWAVSRGSAVEVGESGRRKAHSSRESLVRLEASGELIYGVSTGFGPLKSVVIDEADRVSLQANLIRSHAAGLGEPLPCTVVRAAMLLAAASHLRGFSGVGPEAATALVERLNRDEIPVVPSRGSLGASGDLAPLAHVAEDLLRSGDLVLTSKMGLSLINGTHFHTAIAALSVVEAGLLCKAADLACAMHVEAMLCSEAPFRPEVHALRPHRHQAISAANILACIKGSELVPSHANCGEVQDAYSIRCAPQIHGASRQAIAHLREVVAIELASVTDNPLVFDDSAVSAGNFHGEPVGMASDYAKIGVAELGSVSERRTERALNKDYSRGLPAFLVHDPGLHSGMMICQYTAAALVSENKVLCHPATVDSIPTGANQEDHVSMAMTAAIHLKSVIENVRRILKIELLTAAQALDARRAVSSERPGKGVREAWELIRAFVSPVTEDRSLSREIEELEIEPIVAVASDAVGGLA
jgi:histidine ammonia-lyase